LTGVVAHGGSQRIDPELELLGPGLVLNRLCLRGVDMIRFPKMDVLIATERELARVIRLVDDPGGVSPKRTRSVCDRLGSRTSACPTGAVRNSLSRRSRSR